MQGVDEKKFMFDGKKNTYSTDVFNFSKKL